MSETQGTQEIAGRWLRVSTAGQDEVNQEPDIDRWITGHGYQVGPTYRLHGKSASKGKQDKALDEVIADMHAGVIRVLVVWHSSRIERRGAYNAFDLARRVRDAGGRIEYVQEPQLNETNDMSDVLLALAASGNRKYSQDLSKYVRSSFKRIDENKAFRGRAGYGYRVAGTVRYQKSLAVEPGEARIIREASSRYLDGDTIDAICDDLNERGIPSPTFKGRPGKHWYAKTLAGLLRSPSIAGRRMDSQGQTTYVYEPIITWDEHTRLVKRLDSRAHRKGISPGNVALLTSVLFDSSGHPMYRILGGGPRVRIPYYYCRHGCDAMVRVDEMDARVSAPFERSAAPYKTQQLIPGENHNDEIARLRQDRSELDDMSDDYDARHAEITAEIRRLANLPAEPDRIAWVKTGKTHGATWLAMTTAERRDALLSYGMRVIWQGDGRYEVHIPDDSPLAIDFRKSS